MKSIIRFVGLAAAISVMLCGGLAHARSDVPDPDTWLVDGGVVHDIVVDGNTIYIGGQFDYGVARVGPWNDGRNVERPPGRHSKLSSRAFNSFEQVVSGLGYGKALGSPKGGALRASKPFFVGKRTFQ